MAFRRFEIVEVSLPNGVEHIASLFVVSRKPLIIDDSNHITNTEDVVDKKLVIDPDYENKDDIENDPDAKDADKLETKDKDLFRITEFNLDFEHSDMYFVTYKLFYSDGNNSGWAKPLMITRDTDGYSANDVEIITPRLVAETDPNNAELGGFMVKGSPFETFFGHATHKYTTWRIKDYTGNVIWEKFMDDVNLESIRIPNGILDLNSVYTIEAIYFSNGNVPSNPGRLIIKTKGEYSEVEKVLYGVARPALTGGRVTLEEVMAFNEKMLEAYINDKLTISKYKQIINDKNLYIKELEKVRDKLKERVNELKIQLANEKQQHEKDVKYLEDQNSVLMEKMLNITLEKALCMAQLKMC